MGFATIVGTIFAASVLIFGFVMLYGQGMQQVLIANSILSQKIDLLEKQSKTRLEILNNTVNLTSQIIKIKNTGSTVLKLDCMDYYVDGNYTEFSETILNEYTNPGLLDPGEILQLVPDSPLSSGIHKFVLSTCEGYLYQTYLNVT